MRLRGMLFAALIGSGMGSGASGCASASGAHGGDIGGLPEAPFEADLYDLGTLAAAFEDRGLPSKIDGTSVVTQMEDLGVVLLTQPNAERQFIRLYTVWGRDPSKTIDASWTARTNDTNKTGIVKVYFDDDFDLVAEWYIEVVSGVTPQSVVTTGETFAQRALDAAKGFSDLMR
jgi:hypothetical protein